MTTTQFLVLLSVPAMFLITGAFGYFVASAETRRFEREHRVETKSR